MKTLIVLIITTIVAQFSLQAQDPQWYVPNSLSGTLETNVLLSGISPVSPERANTRHDIFVIFEDNNFYSSRFAFPGRTGLTPNTLDDFTDNKLLINASPAGSSTITHLYWTNLYDDDDDPTVSARAASSDYPDSIFQINKYTETDTMVANHDIVRGTDITVVVPIWKYILTAPNADFILKYNYVVDPSGYSRVENIMSSDLSHGDNSILFNTDKSSGPYEFFYFHVNDNLSITGEGDFLGRFILKKQIVGDSYRTIDILDEKILTSHDPNSVWVKSYCKSGGDTYINYRIHFFNDGEITEEHIKIRFILPDYLEPNSLCEIGSNWNGSYYDTEKKYLQPIESDKIVFYNDSANLSPRIFGDKEADGYIDFCVKLIDSDLSRGFRLEEPTIYFGDQPYEITEFIKDDQLIKEALCTCTCSKPSFFSKPFLPFKWLSDRNKYKKPKYPK